MSIRKTLTALLVTAGLGLGVPAAAQQATAKTDLIPVNVGGPSAGYWNTYLAEQLDIYEKYGLKPKFHWFTSGAPLLAALKSGSIDQVVTGLATVFAIGQNIPLTIVSWELDNGQGEGLIAKDGSGVESYMDIAKAKTIAAQPGTCSQVSLYIIADKAGVDVKDLNVVNLAPPLFANAFASRNSIDAAIGWAPYTIMQGPDVKVVSWDADYGGVCPSVNAFRKDYLEQHPDVPIRMMQAHAEIMERVKQDPSLAIKALEKYLQLTPEVATRFYELHSGDKMPSFEEQLDPESPYSLVSKDGGLAGQLYLASQMLAKAGTIPEPLSWDVINDSIDASYMQTFVAQQQGK